jgi:hypothetical protein
MRILAVVALAVTLSTSAVARADEAPRPGGAWREGGIALVIVGVLGAVAGTGLVG